MKYYYSSSTRGFYVDFIEYPNLPDDIVEISEELYTSLLVGQGNGKVISSDEDGVPYLADPPEPTEEEKRQYELQKRDNLLDVASKKIAPLQDAVDLDMATEEEETQLKAWKKYRVLLNRIEQQDGFPNSIEWPDQPVLS